MVGLAKLKNPLNPRKKAIAQILCNGLFRLPVGINILPPFILMLVLRVVNYCQLLISNFNSASLESHNQPL